jgi:probable rRNA maturation factor
VEYGHAFERELGFLVVHGLLHTLGYDHHTEAEERIMFDLQERILRLANLTR